MNTNVTKEEAITTNKNDKTILIKVLHTVLIGEFFPNNCIYTQN